RLHPRLVEFARETLDLSVFLFQLKLQSFRGRCRISVGGKARDNAFQLMIFAEVLHRTFASYSFHAAYAGRDAAFFQDFDQPNLARLSSMRAAAKLSGEVSDLDHANLVAILLAEQCHRVVLIDSDIDWNVFDDLDLRIAQHLVIDDVFDV